MVGHFVLSLMVGMEISSKYYGIKGLREKGNFFLTGCQIPNFFKGSCQFCKCLA